MPVELTFEQTIANIDQLMGYFQFKSENSEIGQKAIKMLYGIRNSVKSMYKKVIEKT